MKFLCCIVDKFLHAWFWWHALLQDWKESSQMTDAEAREIIINHFDDQSFDEHLFI